LFKEILMGLRRTIHHAIRILGACALFTAVHPATAAAQVDIYPGTNIQNVVNSYPEGTAFRLKSGVHRMQSIRPKHRNSFYGEYGTVLSGARQVSGIYRSGNYWAAPGQTQEAPKWRGVCASGVSICSWPEQFYINGQGLQSVGSLGEVGAGRFYFDYGADTIYFTDDPSNKSVEASVTTTAFEPTGDYVTISNLVIEGYSNTYSSAVVDGTGKRQWIVDNNEIRWNHGMGIRVGSQGEVRSNNVHHNGQMGIWTAGDNIIVENNQISYNNLMRFEVRYEAGGTKFLQSRNLIVRGNYAHHNLGPGLWTDMDNIDTLIEDNVTDDNEWSGIWHEVSYRATIRNNIVRRNGFGYKEWIWGAGILIAASRDVEVSGNFLDGNADGIGAAQQNRGSGSYGAHEVWNLWVHHNTVLNTEGWTAGMVQDVSNSGVYYRNIRFENNIYKLPPTSQNGSPFTWMDGYKNLGDWRNYGLDGGSAIYQPQAETFSYLSDRSWSSMYNGWGSVERDRSNGETGGDGRALTINGLAFSKGLGVHASSDVHYQLGGSCSTFTAIVGIDDEVGSNGSVNFQVYVDGSLRYDSGTMYGSTPAKGVYVNTSGGYDLSLVVTNGDYSIDYDHADWGDARISCR
jgi:parallel beta-helix repeat protein